MADPVVVQPWMDRTQASLRRAGMLLAEMSFEQKIQMATAAGSEEGKALLGWGFADPGAEPAGWAEWGAGGDGGDGFSVSPKVILTPRSYASPFFPSRPLIAASRKRARLAR
jgi:hypothetical protein